MVEEMARQLTMATRRELKDAITQRYQGSSDHREWRQILAEFVRVTGYHRKHALRVLVWENRREHIGTGVSLIRTPSR